MTVTRNYYVGANPILGRQFSHQRLFKNFWKMYIKFAQKFNFKKKFLVKFKQI